MQGFVCFAIPIWLRRLLTMLPAFMVVAFGIDATNALVVSQVVLSIALPMPMLALVILTHRVKFMGRFAERGVQHAAAVAGTIVVLTLNLFLVFKTIATFVSI